MSTRGVVSLEALDKESLRVLIARGVSGPDYLPQLQERDDTALPSN